MKFFWIVLATNYPCWQKLVFFVLFSHFDRRMSRLRLNHPYPFSDMALHSRFVSHILSVKIENCRSYPFWAATPKGQCPVGHRGEFPYVLRGNIWGLSGDFPWYSIGILHFCNFLSIYHVIQWEFYIFLNFHYFLYYSIGIMQFL